MTFLKSIETNKRQGDFCPDQSPNVVVCDVNETDLRTPAFPCNAVSLSTFRVFM